LSIKQAAEGGEVAAEYREQFGADQFDEQGQYIGPGAESEEAGAAPAATPDATPEPPADEAGEPPPAVEATETPPAETT
jgi:small subunit ribosomal protein S1